ncbi:MAG: hypothetical protein M3R62_14425 [Acidobacteriota bacterium]|nr:hypothetical protein [Acidobacteriota bacterium]
MTTASILQCVHGGLVTATLTGVSILSRPSPAPGLLALHVNDVFTVSGSIPQPSPCAMARWLTMSVSLFLNVRSMGMCVSSAQVSQGPVLTSKA